jgi:hypothetical protein
MQFYIGEVPTTRTTLRTVPVGREDYVRYLDFVNTSGSSRTLDIWLNNIKFIHAQAIPAGDRYSLQGIWDLAAGQLIEGQADAAGVNGFISGVDALV